MASGVSSRFERKSFVPICVMAKLLLVLEVDGIAFGA